MKIVHRIITITAIWKPGLSLSIRIEIDWLEIWKYEGQKFHQKLKGLTHGFWWFFEQFQTIKITSKEEGFDNILTFCTDFSHFRTRSIWNFKLKIFTKELPFIFGIKWVNPWFLTIFRPILNHRNILKTKTFQPYTDVLYWFQSF